MDYKVTSRSRVRVLEESSDVHVFRRLLRAVVRKPRKTISGPNRSGTATGGDVGDRTLGGSEQIGSCPGWEGGRGEWIPNERLLDCDRHF